MRKLLRALVGLMLLAPVIIGAAQLVATTCAAPYERIDSAAPRRRVDVPVDAAAGTVFTLQAPSSIKAARNLELTAATYFTNPRATIEVCVRESCGIQRHAVHDNAPLVLALPAEARGEPVRIRIVAVAGGRLAFWGGPGAPAPSWRGRASWSGPVARAAEYAGAFGMRSFPLWLGMMSALLVSIACAAMVASVCRRTDARPPP